MKLGLHTPRENYLDFLLRCILGVPQQDKCLDRLLDNERSNQALGSLMLLLDAAG